MEKVTLEQFNTLVLQNEKPVLLEFTGSFCPGCSAMERVLYPLECEYGESMAFLEVDADHEEMLNTLLHVMTLPATFVFRNGKVLEQHRGFWPRNELEAVIKNALNIEE